MSEECGQFFGSSPSTVAQCSALRPPSEISFTPGACNTLVQSGPAEDKLNIYFIPTHHYTDMASFADDIPAFRDALFAFPFYEENKEKINIFFLASASESDGCELAGNTTPYCPFDNVRALAESGCSYDRSRGDQIVVLFDNDVIPTPYARGESWEDIVFIGSDSSSVFVHEFSHAFGDLGDTYDGSWDNTADPQYPNCASDAPGFTCADKWGDLIGTLSNGQLVGCYQNCHAENCTGPLSTAM
jgi:hypothetical protein